MILPFKEATALYGVFDRKTGERLKMSSGISVWNNTGSVHKAIGFHLKEVTVRSWYGYNPNTGRKISTKDEYLEIYPVTPETTYRLYIVKNEGYYAFVHHGELTFFETEKQLRKFIHEKVFEVREVA